MDAELEFAINYQRALARKRAAAAEVLAASDKLECAGAELDEIKEDAHFSKKLKAAEKDADSTQETKSAEDADFTQKLKIAEHYTVVSAAWALTNGERVDDDWQVEEDAECEACGDDFTHCYFSKLYVDKFGNETTYCASCRNGLDGYTTIAELAAELSRDEDERDDDTWVPLGPEVGKLKCSVCKKAPPTRWLLFSEEFRCDACPLSSE